MLVPKIRADMACIFKCATGTEFRRVRFLIRTTGINSPPPPTSCKSAACMCSAFALRHSIGAKPHTAKPSEDGSRWMMTNEGRERAKARGVRFGRKLKLTAHQRREALARREVGEALTDIARTFGVSHSTISKLAGVTFMQ